jgi:hypothetical protein
MLASGPNRIEARLLAGVASLMLLVPDLPLAICGCSGNELAKPAFCCTCQRQEPGNATEGCCCADDQQATCCRNHQAPDTMRPSARQPGTCTPAGPCKCGDGCACSQPSVPDPQPATPLVPGEGSPEQIPSPSAVCSLAAINLAQAPSVLQAVDGNLGTASTALSNCIALSRFQC